MTDLKRRGGFWGHLGRTLLVGVLGVVFSLPLALLWAAAKTRWPGLSDWIPALGALVLGGSLCALSLWWEERH